MNNELMRWVRRTEKRLDSLERIEVPTVPGGSGVGGSGTSSYLAQWTAATTIGDSDIIDNITGDDLTITAALSAGRALTLPDADVTITGGGTFAMGGFAFTVPATGTGVIGGGSGTNNYLAQWTDANTIANSNIIDSVSGDDLTIDATLTTPRTLTLPDADVSITGGGTLALAGYTLTVPATGTAALGGGSGAANRVAYWSDANTLTSDAGLQVDATNDLYIVADAGGIGNSNTTARLEFDSSGGTDYAYFEDCNVGILTDTPDGEFEVRRRVTGERSFIVRPEDGTFLKDNDGGGWVMVYSFESSTGTDLGGFGAFGGSSSINRFFVGTYSTGEIISFDASGVGINETSPDYKLDVAGVIGVDDNGSDPSTVAGKATVYGNDVGGTTELFGQDDAGNNAQLTAHPTGDLPFTPEPWEHIASYGNAYIGKRRYFRIEAALRDLEASTGKQYIYDVDIPRRDWYKDNARQGKNRPKPQWMRDFEEAQQ